MDAFELEKRLNKQTRQTRIRFEPGTRNDLDQLAKHHYCVRMPATIDRVIRAKALQGTARNETVGVLAVSFPVLNGSWRQIAWPRLYRQSDRAKRARLLNKNVRCISRVIVEPRFRGLSIARRLVQAYLRDPLTPATEAVATMAAYSPFNERAGMTRIELAPARRDRTLLAWLSAQDIRVLDLVSVDWTAIDAQKLAQALRAWAMGSCATRSRCDSHPSELAWLAARRLARPRLAFVHGHGDWKPAGDTND